MLKIPVTVVGNLTADPELRHVNGKDVVNFNIAQTNRFFNRDSQKYVDSDKTSFYRVAAWGALAKNVAASLKKGEQVIVAGALDIVNWERDGKSGTQAEITADAVGPSLQFGTSTFTKHAGGHGNFTTGQRQPQQGYQQQAGGFDPNLPPQEATYQPPQAQQEPQHQQAPQAQPQHQQAPQAQAPVPAPGGLSF